LIAGHCRRKHLTGDAEATRGCHQINGRFEA
jgi:hypothetical protein